MSLLDKTLVGDILPSQQEIKYLGASQLVPEALQFLVDNKIYSAPVRDETTNDFVGFVDLVDIVSFIVDIFDETKLISHQFYAMLQQEIIFGTEYTGAILDLSKRNPYHQLKKSSTLREALEILGKQGVHRIAIVDETNKMVNILSQSTVVSWLAKNLSSFDVLKKNVKEAGLGSKNVITVKGDDKAIQAFQLMEKNRIRSVAVLEQNGALLSSLTPKDLKVVAHDKGFFMKLYATAREFVSFSRQLEDAAFSNAIYCSETDSLDKIVTKLAATRIHRIYVVDEGRKPLSIIALREILSLLQQSLAHGLLSDMYSHID